MTKGQDSAAMGAGDELIERLRRHARNMFLEDRETLCTEAADALAAARQENERLGINNDLLFRRLAERENELAALRQRETELMGWLGWAARRLHPSQAAYIPREFLPLSPAPKEPSHDD